MGFSAAGSVAALAGPGAVGEGAPAGRGDRQALTV